MLLDSRFSQSMPVLMSNINKISFHSLFFLLHIEALWIFLLPKLFTTWKSENENHIHKFIFCEHRSDCPMSTADVPSEIAWEADFHNRSFLVGQIRAINIKYNLLESNFSQFTTTAHLFCCSDGTKLENSQGFPRRFSLRFVASGDFCNRLIYHICCGLLCLRRFRNEWRIEKREKHKKRWKFCKFLFVSHWIKVWGWKYHNSNDKLKNLSVLCVSERTRVFCVPWALRPRPMNGKCEAGL